MALSVSTLKRLNQYIEGVMNRADHHAQNVNEIILTLAGGVIWKATEDVTVRTYKGETANVLWMSINDKTFAFTFDHISGSIELRDRNQNGSVIATFNNQTTPSQVKQVFASL